MHFNKITDWAKYSGAPEPENPLLALVQFDCSNSCLKNQEVSYGFYTICLKKIESGEFKYGKTKYDSNTGFMYFLKPNQTLKIYDVEIKEKGFSIYVDPDYLMGHPLFTEIKKYAFFDYEINEALHLTPSEREIMWSLFHKIETEYYNNTDEFSKDIIISHIDSLLKYAQRFYKRQFIDRKQLSGSMVTKFNNFLDEYFEKGYAGKTGLPTVHYMASKVNLSPKYLSDLLKQETGKTALELIHLTVVSKAKNMIVAGNKSISEIAYELGFENPPYFSRLFKKEVGVSPIEFKNQIMN